MNKNCFMCKTDFDYELGMASHGVKLFPSEEALIKEKSCTETCGIVEVVLREATDEDEKEPYSISFMSKGDFKKGFGMSFPSETSYTDEETMKVHVSFKSLIKDSDYLKDIKRQR